MSKQLQASTPRRTRTRRALAAKKARAIGISTFLIAGLAAAASPASPVAADGGEYKLDFTAAAPQTYDHTTGGGAYNLRAVGVNKDIVESLEGGDFECNDIVTYLTEVKRDTTAGLGTGAETIRIQYSFLADTTGQSGVAMTNFETVTVNVGDVENGGGALGIGGGKGEFDTDTGHVDPGGNSGANLIFEDVTGPLFTKGSELIGVVEVVGIDPGDSIIVRTDVRLGCSEPKPTGNLQAQLNFADVVVSTDPLVLDRIPGGEQTVPFKQVGRIYPVDCPERDFPWDGQPETCNIFIEDPPDEPIVELTSSSSTGGGGGTPVVGAVTTLVKANPQFSSMFAVGGLIGLVALRRRSDLPRRGSS